jgi:sarcosine oxidase gamma subunit
MLDAHSPLGTAARFEREGVALSESHGFTLTQVAGEEKILKKALGKIPTKVGTVLQNDERTLFRIVPKQWCLRHTTLVRPDPHSIRGSSRTKSPRCLRFDRL